MRGSRRNLATVAIVAILVGFWSAFAPPVLGGTTTYVTTYGISMEPKFHRGDLALVRPADGYRVGDVVAFHSQTLHVVVLHRIIAVHDDGTFTTRGDNNDFDDSGQTPPTAVIGKLWIRVGHGGIALELPKNPYLWAVLVLIALLAGLVGRSREQHGQPGQAGRPRRRGQRRRPPAPGLVAVLPPGLGPWAVGLAAAAVLLGGLAFTRPASVQAGRTVGYSHDLTFDYEATTVPGPAYPDGHVRWGDPVYTGLVSKLAVRVAYAFRGRASAPVKGTLGLDVELRSAEGWHRMITSTQPTAFTGSTASGTVMLDLAELRNVIKAVEKSSGSPLGVVTATVTAKVEVNTVVAGRKVRSAAAAPLALRLGATLVTLADPKPGTSTNGGRIDLPDKVANKLPLGPLKLPVTLARILAVLLALAAFVVGYSAQAAARRLSASGSRSAKISHRYHNRIVLVQDLGSGPAVDVLLADDFFRLADQSDEPLLHHIGQEGDVYQLEHGAGRYRYTVHTRSVAGEPAPEPAPVP
jgi:signal peptidase I